MNIREFALELQNIYDEMGLSFANYQNNSGLNCLEGCGKCCSNPDIEASVLEMLPLAVRLHDENKLDEWLEKLENPAQASCLMFQSHSADGSKGQCGAYRERPSVCRMFGVAGYFDKHHEVTLSVCRLIRDKYPELTEIRTKEATAENTPVLVNWSYRMAEIDPALIQGRMPLNQALKLALEKVALYAQYQGQI
jgi:Fe-S-cluster containining protein